MTCPKITTRLARRPDAVLSPSPAAALAQAARAALCRLFRRPDPGDQVNLVTFANEDITTFANENVVAF